ncbi:MAG: hypothetical protein ACO1OB_29465 [Archangium sp.]
MQTARIEALAEVVEATLRSLSASGAMSASRAEALLSVLEAKPECAEAAADLLAEYRKAHWGTFKTYELHVNFWHEGQMRAVAGQRSRGGAARGRREPGR